MAIKRTPAHDAPANTRSAIDNIWNELETKDRELAELRKQIERLVKTPVESAPAAGGNTIGDHSQLGGLTDVTHPLYQRKHGFELAADGSAKQTITYDKTTKVVTVTPTGTHFRFWINGVEFYKAGAQAAPAHGTTTGKYFIYYDATGTLQTSAVETPWSVRDTTVTPVALVYWNSSLSDGVCFYECHTADRNLELHYNLHFSRGTQYISGYDLTGYTLSTGSDAAVTYGIGTGIIADEDIRFASAAVPDGGPYVVFYRSGASGDWTWDATATFPFLYGTTYPSYNQYTGATWQMTELAGGASVKYMTYYICATTAVTPQAAQSFLIPGQTEYTSLTAAQAEGLQSLSLGTLPFEEVAPLYKVIISAHTAITGTHKTMILSITSLKNQSVTVAGGSVGVTDHGSLTGLTDPDHPATAITNTPAGTIAATTVQAAIDELGSEKVAKAGDTMTGSLVTTSAVSDSNEQISVENTNADSSASGIKFKKLSASPAASDYLGHIRFAGYDSGNNLTNFARISGVAKTLTDGVEEGTLQIGVATAGSVANTVVIEPSLVTVAAGLTLSGALTANGAVAGNIPRKLAYNVTPVGNVGAGTDDLIAYTLPGGTLAADGSYIHCIFSGTYANNAAAKTGTVYFGSASSIVLTATGAVTYWLAEMWVIRLSATTQMIHIRGNSNGGAVYNQFIDGTETLANNITIKVTGSSTGAANNDMVQKSLLVEFFP